MATEPVTIDAAVGTAAVAADYVSGSGYYQVVKLDLGADGASAPVVGTMPVSAASLPLPTGAATSSAQATENGYLSTLASAVTASKVQVDIISGGSSGVQYAEGATAATPTGTVVMWKAAANAIDAVSATNPLPTSLASQPLPTGASTSAKQPALGTAGTPSADVISVQGVVSGTPQPVSGTLALSSIIPGTGATNLGKAVNSSKGTTDTVVGVGLIVDASLSALSNADDTYTHGRSDANGAMWTQLAGALAASIDSIQTTPIPGVSSFIHKSFRFTSAQTGTLLWSPASGKRVAVTRLTLATGGTTAGVVTVWFDADGAGAAPKTFNAGSNAINVDMALFDGEFAPSSTARPGAVLDNVWFVGVADNPLRLTTSAGVTLYVMLEGYEI